MSRMRLTRACQAQSQTCVVQGIQEAGHVAVPHPQTAWRPIAKGRLGDIEKVMQSSLVQAKTTLDRVRNDPGEGCQGSAEKAHVCAGDKVGHRSGGAVPLRAAEKVASGSPMSRLEDVGREHENRGALSEGSTVGLRGRSEPA